MTTDTAPAIPREVFLTKRAADAADEFANHTDPESYALGTVSALVALLCNRIAALLIVENDDTDAGRLLRAKHLASAAEQMDEALDLLNGWHAAQDRLAVKRSAENSLSTVAWPDSPDRCRRCDDTGLVRGVGDVAFCDCAVGAAARQAALDRAFQAAS